MLSGGDNSLFENLEQELAQCKDEEAKKECYDKWQRRKFQAKFGSKAVQKLKTAVWKLGKQAKFLTAFDNEKISAKKPPTVNNVSLDENKIKKAVGPKGQIWKF